MAHKLLLADDSITIQKVVELVLAEEEFEIKSVSNGEDALNAINTFNPDIVLADIEMPKINGYQLCEKIKQNPKTAGIPVILLAGAFEPIDENLAREVGSDDSVIKPFESQELISKINAALTMVSTEGQAEVSAEEAGEEALEFMEEEQIAGVEAEALEVTGMEEDLWAMEEISEVQEEVAAEPAVAEEAFGIEEVLELPEEEIMQKPEPVITPKPGPAFIPKPEAVIPEEIAQPKVRKEAVLSEAEMPSKEELIRIFEKAVNERVSAFLSTVDIKDSILSSLMPSMKDSIEKVLWEVAPELVEKMLKEILKGSIASLTTEVEKVIWETVPDLAGTLISREIEKIKSEF